MPLLEVDARAVGPHRRVLADLVHFVTHVLDQGTRPGLAAERAADEEHGAQHVVDGARVRAEHRDPTADQVADHILLEIREREHQIGLERQDLVEPERGEAPDRYLLTHGLRPARRARDADHPVAGAHEVGDLRGVGGETDDPLRELGRRLAVHGG